MSAQDVINNLLTYVCHTHLKSLGGISKITCPKVDSGLLQDGRFKFQDGIALL